MRSNRAAPKHAARRPKRLSLWHRFVLLIGYASLLYLLARGVIWVLVLLGGKG